MKRVLQQWRKQGNNPPKTLSNAQRKRIQKKSRDITRRLRAKTLRKKGKKSDKSDQKRLKVVKNDLLRAAKTNPKISKKLHGTKNKGAPE